MKHKGRYIVALIIILSLLFLAFKNNSSAAKPITYEIYTVQPGDTLWSIAESYPHNSIESLIYGIEKSSDTSALISVGQELRIPIEKE